MRSGNLFTKNLSLRSILGFTLTLLLVIQQFALQLIPVFAKSNYELSAHYIYAYLIFSYGALTAIIALEIKQLHEFHVENLSLWLLIFSSFVRARLGMSGERYYLVPIMLFGLIGVLLMLFNRQNIPRITKQSIIAGITVAFFVLAFTTFVESFQADKWLTSIYTANIGLNFLRQLIYQLSFVVLIEELIFRSFLVGYLIKLGLQEKTAFVVQALLFWLTHYARIGNPITFFISIPVLVLSTSLVVRHYKQVFPAIIIHTSVNVLLPFLINIWY